MCFMATDWQKAATINTHEYRKEAMTDEDVSNLAPFELLVARQRGRNQSHYPQWQILVRDRVLARLPRTASSYFKNPSQELPQQFTFLSKWQQNTPLPFRTFTFNRNFIFPAGTMIVSTISVCKQFLELCTCGARVKKLFWSRMMLSPTNCLRQM